MNLLGWIDGLTRDQLSDFTEVMFAVRRGDLDADTDIATIIEAQERFERG